MSKDKLDQNIRKNLFSADTETAVSAIKTIKHKGNRLYLPILFDLLVSQPEDELRHEIIQVLGTIKHQDTVPFFVKALEENKYRPIRKILLTACWQNGLDFSHYLPVFADIIIEEEWETGFEAFTIVDNMEHFPDKEIIDETALKIKNSIAGTDGKKKYLLEEFLVMIQ